MASYPFPPKYTVVEFVDGGVEAILSSWLLAEQGKSLQCYMPTSHMRRKRRENIKPVANSPKWVKRIVKREFIKGRTDCLETVLRRAKRASVACAGHSMDSRKRKSGQRSPTSDEDSSSDDESDEGDSKPPKIMRSMSPPTTALMQNPLTLPNPEQGTSASGDPVTYTPKLEPIVPNPAPITQEFSSEASMNPSMSPVVINIVSPRVPVQVNQKGPDGSDSRETQPSQNVQSQIAGAAATPAPSKQSSTPHDREDRISRLEELLVRQHTMLIEQQVLMTQLTTKIDSMSAKMDEQHQQLQIQDLVNHDSDWSTVQALEQIMAVFPGPAQSEAELMELDERCLDEEFRRQMTTYLASLGGKDLNDSLRRMLRAISSGCVWNEYSYFGRRGKKPFEKLLISKLVINAVQRNYGGVTMHNIQTAISDILKVAKRWGGKKKEDSAVSSPTCATPPVISIPWEESGVDMTAIDSD